MIKKFNQQLNKIEKENAFSRSTAMVKAYKKEHPEANVVSLGIGDVSFPVPEPVVEAMKKACDDLKSMDNFQGYGAYWGLESLRKTIAENDYKGLNISADEIYVGDGTKTDSTAILELFDKDVRILVGNPMYPIYQNGAYAMGRDVHFADCDKQFKMLIPGSDIKGDEVSANNKPACVTSDECNNHYDVIYICSPCNPVGNAYTADELSEWIAYAKANDAVIIYDNVYNDFAESEGVPRSIYQLVGSKETCIELRSYSKNVSFSGTRCSYFVLPKEFGEELHALWRERTINRFNGASYIAQKGAEASYLPEAKAIIKSNIKAYKENARLLKEGLTACGFDVIGGVDSPYLWVETPDKKGCWEAFKFFLEELNIVLIPGSIFGSEGKYRLRISSLGSRESCIEAIKRIKRYYGK